MGRVEDDKPAPTGKWPNGQGKKSLYDLIEVRDIFESYSLTQKDLGQALFDCQLRRPFGFPYSEDREQTRPVDFEPEDFKLRFRDTWAFAVRANYYGDMYYGDEPDSGEHTIYETPLSLFPHAVESERGMLNEHGELIVTEAVVYISNDALEEFVARQFPEEAEPSTEATNGNDGDEHVEADTKDEGLESQPKASESQQAAEIEPAEKDTGEQPVNERRSALQRRATAVREANKGWSKRKIAKFIYDNDNFEKQIGQGKLSAEAIEREIRLSRPKRRSPR